MIRSAAQPSCTPCKVRQNPVHQVQKSEFDQNRLRWAVYLEEKKQTAAQVCVDVPSGTHPCEQDEKVHNRITVVFEAVRLEEQEGTQALLACKQRHSSVFKHQLNTVVKLTNLPTKH